MERPTPEIEGCRLAHRRLALALESVNESVSKRPSLLPDWSVGHVLGHLALNAEAMIRRIEAARAGVVIEQYAGGRAGRAAAISAAANRSAFELVAEVRMWSERLEDTFSGLDDGDWRWPVRSVNGTEHPVGLLPFRRWREVEVHHVDLNIGFRPSDWSPELIERALPRLIAGLPGRTDRAELAAWLLGRGSAPDLEAWG